MAEYIKGKVTAPKPKPWLYRDLFRQNVQKKFVGEEAKVEDLSSDEGKAKIAEAHAETASALGYTLEEAVEQDELEEVFRELQYSKPRSGEEELKCCEVDL